MNTQQVRPEDFNFFFDYLSRLNLGRQVLLESIGEEIGDQIEESWNLFQGFTYDYKTGELLVITPGGEHVIVQPKKVMILEEGSTRAVGTSDGRGYFRIIHFREPLMLEGH